jgi:hypothetical protein
MQRNFEEVLKIDGPAQERVLKTSRKRKGN